MSINENENGKNEFDPTKKVRAVLGDDFVDEVEADALAKLSAASKAAVVSNNVYEEPGSEAAKPMGPADWVKRIKHTNPIVKPNEDNFVKETDEGVEVRRMNGIEEARKLHEEFVCKKGLITNIKSGVLGINPGSTTSETVTSIVNTAVRGFCGFTANDVIETSFGMNDNKKLLTGIGVGAVLDVIGSYGATVNNKTLNKFFNENNITKAESDIINAEIRKEKIKYTAEHLAAAVVIPAAAKFGIDKLVKEKNSDAIGLALSFGTLSTIGKIALQVVRKIGDSKLEAELAETSYKVPSSGPNPYYKNLAKAMAHRFCDTQIDTTIVTGAAGTYFGYKSGKTFNTTIQSEGITCCSIQDIVKTATENQKIATGLTKAAEETSAKKTTKKSA